MPEGNTATLEDLRILWTNGNYEKPTRKAAPV